MSSDESDFEGDRPTYTIAKKTWRSTAVTLWLRDMDAVDLSIRTACSDRITRGNWPHPRRESSGTLSSRPPVGNLPINFYDHRWLEDRAPEERELLAISEDRYDLSHTDNIYRYVAIQNVVFCILIQE